MRGSIGARSVLCNAEQAGCTWRLRGEERKKWAAMQRNRREAEQITKWIRSQPFDPSPRLRKRADSRYPDARPLRDCQTVRTNVSNVVVVAGGP
jgi:hypothetical protein